jgi:hypothetical protein
MTSSHCFITFRDVDSNNPTPVFASLCLYNDDPEWLFRFGIDHDAETYNGEYVVYSTIPKYDRWDNTVWMQND